MSAESALSVCSEAQRGEQERRCRAEWTSMSGLTKQRSRPTQDQTSPNSPCWYASAASNNEYVQHRFCRTQAAGSGSVYACCPVKAKVSRLARAIIEQAACSRRTTNRRRTTC